MRDTLILIVLLTIAPGLAQAGAPAPAPPTNEDCLGCHSDSETKRADGSPVVVDQEKFGQSVHGQLELKCIDCHADLAAAELPHNEKLAKVQCSTCHEAAAAAYRKGVHSDAQAKGNTRAAGCASCHTAHEIRSASDPESSTYHLNLPRTCGQCHGSQTAGVKMPGGDVFAQYHDSIHGRALEKAGLLVAPSCASCHGAHDIISKKVPESRVYRTNIPATCGKCHQGVQRTYAASVHGQEMAKGNARAPVCVTCHTAHGIQDVTEEAFRVKLVDKACGACHKESLMTYRDTFHGQVTELGFAQVATCADCHTAHAQFPKSDSRSQVSEANRVKTCQRCHADANSNFARYDPHANAHDHERGAVLFYSARFMQLLLAGVFGFFGLHTSLWFTRSYRDVRARRAAPRGDQHV